MIKHWRTRALSTAGTAQAGPSAPPPLRKGRRVAKSFTDECQTNSPSLTIDPQLTNEKYVDTEFLG